MGLLALAVAFGCSSCSEGPPPRARNVLIVVLDDVGVDKVEPYARDGGPERAREVPPTPVMTQLAREGLRFTNAYSDPICSPSRASLLTGRDTLDHGVRTALKGPELNTAGSGLDPDLATLADIWPGPSAWFGKWHVSAFAPGSPEDAPGRVVDEFGFDRFSGRWANGGYKSWTWMMADGDRRLKEERTEHPTTRTTLDALDFVTTTPDGWLAVVAYQSAHTPFHRPPDPTTLPVPLRDAQTTAYSAIPGRFDVEIGDTRARRHYNAMVQSLDHHLGVLLRAVDPATTTVIVVGDNGTPTKVADEAFTGGGDQGKSAPYEGGIAIPFLVSSPELGPGRAGGDEDALVHISDVFATVHALAGATAQLPPDSFDLLPYLRGERPARERRWVYTETRRPWEPPFNHADNPPFISCHLGLIQDGRKLVVMGRDAKQRIELYDVSRGGAPLAYETPGVPYEPTTAPMGDRCLAPLSEEDAAHYRALRDTLARRYPNSCWWLEHERSCCDGVDDDGDGVADADDPDCACDPDRHLTPEACRR